MKIVIPTDNNDGLRDNVAEHFGRCNTYTFLNEKGEVVEIIKNTGEHMGGQGLPPELMKQHGADVLLCHGLGPKAIDLCANLGIAVYVGSAATVKEIFERWRSNKIKKAGAADACQHHKI